MSRVITRDIICDYINYDGYSKDDLCKLINRWKRLLITRYGAKKGQSLGIGIFEVNPNHIALLIAAGEIGMKVMVLVKPLSMETKKHAKIAVLGGVDICVVKVDPLFFDQNVIDLFAENSQHLIYDTEIDNWTDDRDIETEQVYPSDTYLLTSTSGSTGKSKKVEQSHDFIHRLSRQNIKQLSFTRESTTIHNVNMHHMSALVMDLFPSMMVVEKHYYGTINKGYEEQFILDYVINSGVQRLLSPSLWELERIIPAITTHKEKFNKKLKITTVGYAIPEYVCDWCKDLPIIVSTGFGTAQIGAIAYWNIDNNTTYIPNYVGELCDYVKLECVDGMTYLTNELFGFERVLLDDDLELDGRKLFYRGRIGEERITHTSLKIALDQQADYSYVRSKETNRRYLILWDVDHIDQNIARDIDKVCEKYYFLSKKDYSVENKVTFEQLIPLLDKWSE